MLVTCLAACNSPSVAFQNAVSGELEVDGIRFGIHAKGGRVEVHRLGWKWRPNMGEVRRAARRAIEEATGCSVVSGSLNGDQAILRAEIDCT